MSCNLGKTNTRQTLWVTPITVALGRLRQDCGELETALWSDILSQNKENPPNEEQNKKSPGKT